MPGRRPDARELKCLRARDLLGGKQTRPGHDTRRGGTPARRAAITWKQPHQPRLARPIGGILMAGTWTLTRDRPRRRRAPTADRSSLRGTRRRHAALSSLRSGRESRFKCSRDDTDDTTCASQANTIFLIIVPITATAPLRNYNKHADSSFASPSTLL